MSEKNFIETLLSHRSIRQFKSQQIASDIIEQLVDVARFASSSNHLQCISIVRVMQPQLRHELMLCASGQAYVESAAEFWVFCADFNKHKQICPEAQLDYTEVMLIGAVDAGIMAQNVLAAAENLGLGGVYIGSIRNQIEKVGELLNLPEYVVPLFGMCLGYPDQNPPLKPRLPQELMFFENQYRPLDKTMLNDYDKEVAEYYKKRSQADMDWSRNVAKTLGKPVRPQVLGYLQKQGFVKK
ncbi:oxygen-insensitive NADPH nitroreductase [Basfia succiniciproducens]|uniref:Nitroreductase n=1 Tax=Basfia succiniciproducens TaxID=653940 RepID=A0A1G5BYE1_9PAST|nr:oxygen-insensitive NADPH nitroreductase [Basfia succiniciproducens]QIM68184.1 nitroreductase A [Basfia succiniciproducens]SCX95279.1 nitroreductase [Basfia succiniciproducens]